jgi:hypothetical protein
MPTKALIASSTFWFGLVQIIMGVAGFFTGILDQQLSMGLIVTGLGTIGFRLPTKTAIGGVFSA